MNRLSELASILKDVVVQDNSEVKVFKSLMELLYFRATWKKHDLDYVPSGKLPECFMSARKAAELIADHAHVATTGLAGNSRCSIFYWAIRDRFEQTRHPVGLTWTVVSAVGGRGRAPGTIEECGLPGLITRHIGGHLESHKALLELADQGRLELHTISQGVLSHLIEAQGRREYSLKSRVGVGTFIDPRVGNGSCVLKGLAKSLVRVNGDLLEYSLPPIDVAMFCAPYADAEGNIYFRNAAVITENREVVQAARANGGLVMATVCDIVDKKEDEISIPSDLVDVIVVNPRNEQTGGILQRKYVSMLTQGAQVNTTSAYNLFRFANTFTGFTPIRDECDHDMARQAASILLEETTPGSFINIGIGMPEEVSRCLLEDGSYRRFTFSTEAGVYGGLPASGMYFGAAINPIRIMSSAEMFRLYERNLDATVLGFLQVDSEGNVNVSRRGPRAIDFVGPGGFIDIVTYAKTIIFIGKWMQGAKYAFKKGRLSIIKSGLPKFVDRVDEITFNGREALTQGKKVYYVTNVGVFKPTEQGLALIRVAPGIDVERDIIQQTRAKVVTSGMQS